MPDDLALGDGSFRGLAGSSPNRSTFEADDFSSNRFSVDVANLPEQLDGSRLADCKRVSRTRQIVQSLITGAIDVVILVPVTAHTQPKR